MKKEKTNQNGFRIKSGMTGESGRSMVEMLGVLAVIGVLSVGGIAGYTSAMNKHRANELLHQVSMRAASCMAQLASGNTSLSVADFGDYDGYTFTPSYDTANKTYSIQIGGNTISKVICNNMKNALPSNVQMTVPTSCGDTNNNVKLTYQDDVSPNSEPELGLKQNVPCGSGFCFKGQTCTDAEDGSCNGWSSESGKCCVDTNNVICPTGQIYSEYYDSCIECPSSDFVLESNGKLICCQRGTGKFFGGDGYHYGGNNSLEESACCTEQGGFVDGDNYACCKGNMYDIQGRLHYRCNTSGCSLIGKKSDGRFYEIYESSCPDGFQGCVDVSEYVEWHKCWCDEADDTEFCDQASEEGYSH